MAKVEETANTLYQRFVDESTLQTLTNGQEVRVWRGKLVETCLDLGIPYGSYRKNVKSLEQIGSIQVLVTGVRASPTVIALLQPPTEELWANRTATVEKTLTKQAEDASLLGEAREIIQKLGGLDVEKLTKVLINLEERITALESKSKERNGKTQSK